MANEITANEIHNEITFLTLSSDANTENLFRGF